MRMTSSISGRIQLLSQFLRVFVVFRFKTHSQDLSRSKLKGEVWGVRLALVVFHCLSTVSSFSSDLENLTWQTPPIVMVIGYSRVLTELNRFPVTHCVTHNSLVRQCTRRSAQVTSSICGVHRAAVLHFPPKMVGLVLLAGTRGLTMTGGC